MAEPRFCEDCKHVSMGSGPDYYSGAQCVHPDVARRFDLCWGSERGGPHPADERGKNGGCGPEGTRWEADGDLAKEAGLSAEMIRAVETEFTANGADPSTATVVGCAIGGGAVRVTLEATS